MGKGDQKSRRGKISKGSFGVHRKHKSAKAVNDTSAPEKSVAEELTKKNMKAI